MKWLVIVFLCFISCDAASEIRSLNRRIRDLEYQVNKLDAIEDRINTLEMRTR